MSDNAKSAYFEDYKVGDVYEFGSATVSEAELTAFAERYDPQVFHVNAVAAAGSHFGGLIASGWHTCAIMMRMMVDHYISDVSSLGSPGVDEIRWLKPVRPGDTLSVRVTVLESRPSRSKPDRGVVRSKIEVIDQNAVSVMSMKSLGMFRRRPLKD